MSKIISEDFYKDISFIMNNNSIFNQNIDSLDEEQLKMGLSEATEKLIDYYDKKEPNAIYVLELFHILMPTFKIVSYVYSDSEKCKDFFAKRIIKDIEKKDPNRSLENRIYWLKSNNYNRIKANGVTNLILIYIGKFDQELKSYVADHPYLIDDLENRLLTWSINDNPYDLLDDGIIMDIIEHYIKYNDNCHYDLHELIYYVNRIFDTKIKDYIEVDNEWYDKLFKIMVEDKSLEKFDEVIRRYLDEGIEYDPYINEGSTK